MRTCIVNDKCRREKNMIRKTRKGQEEMVGFIVIVIIVSVVLLVLLGFMLRAPNKASEDYKIESFIESALQYTSSCETDIDFLSVQNLIVSCERESACLNGENSCDVLNETLNNLVKSAWNVNNQSAVKGYKLGIMAGERGVLMLQEGNETRNYKGGMQDFAKSGDSFEISLNVYS
jgi:hypothetical protein